MIIITNPLTWSSLQVDRVAGVRAEVAVAEAVGATVPTDALLTHVVATLAIRCAWATVNQKLFAHPWLPSPACHSTSHNILAIRRG